MKSPAVLTSKKQSTSWLFVFLSVLLSVLALLSKEQGITVLGVSIAYDILLHWPLIMNAVNITLGKTSKQEGGGGGGGKNDVLETHQDSDAANGHNTNSCRVRGATSSQSLPQESLAAMLGRIGGAECESVELV